MRQLAIALIVLTVPGSTLAAPPATQPTSQPDALTPGDHVRTLALDGLTRTYLVHVPPGYDPEKPTPVVLVFHGGRTTAQLMVAYCGLNKKADAAGFIAVYPNGQGRDNQLFFNTWERRGVLADDVQFTARLLDDLATVANIDPKRVFATGISDGAMMSYLLAARLSDRIAAIAPVAGTLAVEDIRLKRPVPVMHFHGTADTFVPYDGPKTAWQRMLKLLPVDDAIRTWAKLNGCPEQPTATTMPDTTKDGTTVTQKVYGPGTDGAEVVLFVIEGGGHTWPGRLAGERLLGKATVNISANDLMWDFFQKHPMK